MVDALALSLRDQLQLPASPAALLQQARHAWQGCDAGCLAQALGWLLRQRLPRDLDVHIGGTTTLLVEVSLRPADTEEALETLVLCGVRPEVHRDDNPPRALWRVPRAAALTVLGPLAEVAAHLAVLERLVLLRSPQEPRYTETYLERRRPQHVQLLLQLLHEQEETRAQTQPSVPMKEWRIGQRVFRADFSPHTLVLQQGIVTAAGPRRITVEYTAEGGTARQEERLDVACSNPRGWATTEAAARAALQSALQAQEARLTAQLTTLQDVQRRFFGGQDVGGALADAAAKALGRLLGAALETEGEPVERVEQDPARTGPARKRPQDERAARALPLGVSPPPSAPGAPPPSGPGRTRALAHLLNEADAEGEAGPEVPLQQVFQELEQAAQHYGRALGLEERSGGWLYAGSTRLFQGWAALAAYLQKKRI
ncbi:MAG TPA: hypothetical protein PLL39_16750, partial [Rhodocyclaceae bacterium]|nr:hypothetical protein [Rhodocyclaceae bacterium]